MVLVRLLEDSDLMPICASRLSYVGSGSTQEQMEFSSTSILRDLSQHMSLVLLELLPPLMEF